MEQPFISERDESKLRDDVKRGLSYYLQPIDTDRQGGREEV